MSYQVRFTDTTKTPLTVDDQTINSEKSLKFVDFDDNIIDKSNEQQEDNLNQLKTDPKDIFQKRQVLYFFLLVLSFV